MSEALLLASASPRRRELLERVGVRLVVSPVEVDETALPDEPPDAYLERIVTAKQAAAVERLAHGAPSPHPRSGVAAAHAGVLVADTTVICDEVILSKPRGDAEATTMIHLLAGRWHRVATRFALLSPDRRQVARTISTRVRFRPLSTEEIQAYVDTREGVDKAGGYGIQGIGAMLVEAIEGSYTNVVGLPLAEVVVALQELEMWSPQR